MLGCAPARQGWQPHETLLQVVAVVEHCGDGQVPLEELAAAYTGLQRRYPEEYTMYNLAAAALSSVCHCQPKQFDLGSFTLFLPIDGRFGRSSS